MIKHSSTKLFGILFLTAIMFTNSVYSQTDEQDTRFGIKGGVNISNMFTEDIDDKNTVIGFNAGLFFKLPLTSNFSFQPELLYTTKGAELNYSSALISGSATFSLGYIEMPLLAVINLTENVNIHGGVYLASLASASVKNVSDVGLFNFEDELDRSDFETFDYGLVFGAGLEFDKINLGLRYEYGMKPVGKEREIVGRIPDARNSTLQVYIGISIL
jgi:hypothetical protein